MISFGSTASGRRRAREEPALAGTSEGEGESTLKVLAIQTCSGAVSLGDRSTSRRFAMTKQGSFKRAVRRSARESGQRYTEARAALAKGKSAEQPTRPFQHTALKAHLEAHYGIRITSMAPIDDPGSRPRGSWDGHYPATLLVKRKHASPWWLESSPPPQTR